LRQFFTKRCDPNASGGRWVQVPHIDKPWKRGGLVKRTKFFDILGKKVVTNRVTF